MVAILSGPLGERTELLIGIGYSQHATTKKTISPWLLLSEAAIAPFQFGLLTTLLLRVRAATKQYTGQIRKHSPPLAANSDRPNFALRKPLQIGLEPFFDRVYSCGHPGMGKKECPRKRLDQDHMHHLAPID